MGNLIRRLLRLEPGITLGWWAFERVLSIVSNWAFFWGVVSGSAMTYLSAISAWAEAYGPAAVGGVGVGTALVTMLIISRVRLWNAQRAVENANERYVIARADKSTVNPLDSVFTNQRIDLRDLVRPLTNEIKSKTFVKCQIVGPVNLVLWETTNIAAPNGVSCEAVYVDNGVRVSNAMNIINCDFRECEFFNVTFMVLNNQYDHFTSQILTNWITSNPKNYTEYDGKEMLVRADADQPQLPHFESEQASADGATKDSVAK